MRTIKEQLEEYFINLGDKKFRATQIYEWVYRKGVGSFDEMSNISKDVIEELKKDFYFNNLKIIRSENETGEPLVDDIVSEGDVIAKEYIVQNKKLISFRTERVMTEAQLEVIAKMQRAKFGQERFYGGQFSGLKMFCR